MKVSNILYILGFVSIAVSATNYLKGKAGGTQNDDKAGKERDGLFTGHWAPTFFILGKIIEDREDKHESLVTGQ
jgi:hypothetical protein